MKYVVIVTLNKTKVCEGPFKNRLEAMSYAGTRSSELPDALFDVLLIDTPLP